MIAAARTELVARIQTAPSLAALPVWWAALPANTTLPALRITLVTDQRGASHAGTDGRGEATVQVDVFSDDPNQAEALRDAVLDVAHGYRGGLLDAVLHDASREDVDEEGTASASCDLSVIYRLA